MRGLVVTGALLVGLLFSVGTGPAYAASNACSPIEAQLGSCPTVGIGNGGVDLGIGVTNPGEREVGSGGGGDGLQAPVIGTTGCSGVAGSEVCRDGFGVTLPLDARGPITLADLVNFRPVVGVLRTEPAGWAVVGLPTNLYVEATQHVEDDLLLGLPASVRFTPVRFAWTYGDGTATTTPGAGASWQTLRANEFDVTPTSHIYATAGVFQPSVVASFRAEYRFGAGGGWTAIDGTVPVTVAAQTVTAGSATTVLVQDDCRQNPRGPGC